MLSFLSLLVLPATYASHHLHPRHHTGRAVDAHTGDKEFTFYDAGLGACGGTNSNSDFVVAMNIPQWDGGADCYKEITITYKDKTTKAQVVDRCGHCAYGGLDLSRGLFDFFEDEDVGLIHGNTSKSVPLETSSSVPSETSSSVSRVTTSIAAAPTVFEDAPSQVMAQFSDALVSLLGLVVQAATV
ncbi:RlpA-like double-psi beta-barrel-protein domain-containing protein-containing protein [Mycena polygramma]|nr:RlpA-like double-psi beta-barrel-protein domain-containing protein-containing protein [Mycena polygramma]